MQPHSRTLWPSPATMPKLSAHQAAILPDVLSSRVGILSGTPGTGKSFVTAEIIRAVANTYGAHTIATAAPFGKAASRMAAIIAAAGVTIRPTTTIHRLLETTTSGGHWRFERHAGRRLDQKFFFIDEAGTLDTSLSAALFAAMPQEAHVLLIGDPYQLPPVGHGAPFRDMIASKIVPSGELTEVRRNSGDVVAGCKRIKAGEVFAPNCGKLDLEAGRNWLHIEIANPAKQLEKLFSLLGCVPDKFDRIFDVQVICAVNEKGPLNRKELNAELQRRLNPSNPIAVNRKFAVGDKVVCTKNSWLEECFPVYQSPVKPGTPPVPMEIEKTGSSEFVSNGDCGRVTAMTDRQAVIELLYPPRTVVIPLSASKSAASGASLFDLAYALTCHKMQGSQVPVVISLIDDSPGANFVTSREWHYTAISRMEQVCITIGRWDVFMKQCQPVSLLRRKTFLTELLKVA